MIQANRLYFGDNLDFLRNQDYFPTESVDLVYLDPPFNSAQSYNILYKEERGTPSTAQVKAFEDTWKWDQAAAMALHQLNTEIKHVPRPLVGLMNTLEEFLGHSPMLAYLAQMAVRLVEMHRILKPTGSLFLHCDPTASHYLKLVLDGVFGPKLFRNEIVWHYRRWTASSKRLQRMHDIIFFYTKRDENRINPMFVSPMPGKERVIERGWTRNTVPIDGVRKPQLIVYDREKVDQAVKTGRIDLTEFARVVEPNTLTIAASDVWIIPHINSQSKERLGYQTQKPRELLVRILKSASAPGSVILDPFCGCGTTLDAVETLNQENPNETPRKWIGIDITHLAIDLIKSRLATRFGLSRGDYDVIGEPTTLEEALALRDENRYQFQYWALGLIAARPWGEEKKKGKDRGIDGYRSFLHGPERSYQKCIVQVKSGKVGVAQVRDLKGTMERENAELAAFITLEQVTAEMKREAAAAGFYQSEVMHRDYPRLQLLTIEELMRNPDAFKIPPGGEYQPAPKFTPKPKPQENIF